MTSLRRMGLLIILALSSSSCIFGNSPQGATDELAQLSSAAGDATYAAIYRFTVTGQLAGAVTTRLEIVQDPPVSLRKLDTPRR